MWIALCVVAYILIGCVIGVIFDYFYNGEDDEGAFFIGIFWGILFPIGLIAGMFYLWCTVIRHVIKYLDKEGFHYYSGKMPPCCGQCIHMKYCNYINETCKCTKDKLVISQTEPACGRFRKNPLWRFTIRVGWNKNLD